MYTTFLDTSRNYKALFGWVVAFEKAVVSYGKAAVGKAEGRLVKQLWLLQ
jgi:hypothetical protein